MPALRAHDRSVARLEDARRSAVTDLGESGSALSHAAAVFASIAGAHSWFVLGGDDEETRALARDLRLRGDELPALVAVARRPGVLYVALGRLESNLAVIRLAQEAERGFSPQRVAETRAFLDEHGATLTHLVLDGHAPAWKRVSAPLSFVIDERLRPVMHEDGPQTQTAPSGFYDARDGAIGAPLRRVLSELIEEVPAGGAQHRASRALPLATVRVTRMRGSDRPVYLVSIEPLRRRSGVLRAMARYKLSRREGQVLTEALRGASSGEIAERLSIAPSTATFHLKALLRKTGARNRAELNSRVLEWEDAS